MFAIGLDSGAVRRVNAIHLQPLARPARRSKTTIADGQQQGWDLVERAVVLQRIAESDHDALAFSHADRIDSVRLLQGLGERRHGVASHGDKDGGIGALDLFGVQQDRGNIQNVQAGDAHQLGAKPPDDPFHAASFKTHIDDANLMSACAERRRNVFQSQWLGAKKRSKPEVSGQMSWFNE